MTTIPNEETLQIPYLKDLHPKVRNMMAQLFGVHVRWTFDLACRLMPCLFWVPHFGLRVLQPQTTTKLGTLNEGYGMSLITGEVSVSLQRSTPGPLT